MGTIVALAGWPEVETPPAAWTGRGPNDLPVTLAALAGAGGPVASAASRDGRSAAVVAGSIANRRELEQAVGGGAAAGGRGDAALLLRLYESRGEQAVSALRGEFAVAVFDGHRRRLLLARDQVGAVPLYHAAGRDRCAAASSLLPLLGLPDVAGAPDLAALDVLLALGAVPAPATLYPGVRQLRPGELLVWEPGRQRTHRYWQPRFPEPRAERRIVSREGARRTREQLDDALRVRTTGVVSALLLSDGLGSTALLGLARALDRPLACAVTVDVEGAPEVAARAAQAARRAGVEHVVVTPHVDWTRAADDSIAAHGMPIGGVDEPYLTAALAAAGERAKTVLVGAGRESLGGGAAERALTACARYQALPGLVREAADVVAATGRAPALAWVVQATRRAPIDVYADLEARLAAEGRLALYTPAMRALAQSGAVRSLLVALQAEAVAAGATDAGDLVYFLRLATGLPRVATSWRATAPADVTVRLPLADGRLAQLAASVPPRVRAPLRAGRRLLEDAVADVVPLAVRRRPHRPMAPAPSAWRCGALRDLVEETLAPARVAALGVFDPGGVADLVAALGAGRGELAAVVWTLVLASRWLERPPRAAAVQADAPARESGAASPPPPSPEVLGTA